jgi:hypothetical protein
LAKGLLAALTATEWTGLIVVVGLGLMVVLAAMRPRGRVQVLRPPFFFFLAILYLVVLLFLAVLFEQDSFGVKEDLGEVIGNVLPIGVPWFGALGAVLISLQGVFEHNQRWDHKWNFWHLARPVFGAVLGIVAYFIFILILRAAGTAPTWLGTATSPPVTDLVVYYVLAFLVGYREANFAELIRRATDLIFKAGGLADVPMPAVTFQVQVDSRRSHVTIYDMGTLPVRDSTKSVHQQASDATEPKTEATFIISNTGARTLTTPTLVVGTVDPPDADVFASISSADQVTSRDLAPGQESSFSVSFVPRDPKRYSGEVRVVSPALASPAVLQLTGAGEEVGASTSVKS